MLALATAAWLDHLVRQAGRSDLIFFDAVSLTVAATHVGLATIGAVIASRRPRHPVGWLLLLAFGLLGQAAFAVAAYADYGLLARPGTVPGVSLAARCMPAIAAAGFACLAFILLLTPTGTLPSRWAGWRWLARLTAATPAALLLLVALVPGPDIQPYHRAESPFDLRGFDGVLLAAFEVALTVSFVAVAVGAASLMVRFRRARGAERQQLRWVSLAAALAGLMCLAMLAAVAIGAPALPDPSLVGSAALVVLTLGISAATFGYRLYDLDRIISRTVTYALLTVLLGGGYAMVIIGLSQLAGSQSSLVVTAATLALAALFHPVRRRVQQVIDRRFNRRRYDAAQTIQGFTARLREQIDLDSLTTELLAVVDQTMQPAAASLWLRQASRAQEKPQLGQGVERSGV